MFGKKRKQEIEQLKKTIATLEKNKHIFLTKAEKALERERRANAAKQQADEEIKRLKQQLQRIQEKQTTTQKTTPQEQTTTDQTLTRQYNTASRTKLKEILGDLETYHTKKARLKTIYLKPDTQLPDEINTPQLTNTIRELESETGYAIFHDENNILNLLLVPPLPITHNAWQQSNHFNTTPLKNLIETTDTILILIAHAGESFAMLTTPRDIITHTEIRSSVKAKHSKGGWSQRRFERLREEDIKHHTDKIKHALTPLLNEEPKHIITAGDQRIIKQALNREKILYQKLDTPQKYLPDKILKEALRTKIYKY